MKKLVFNHNPKSPSGGSYVALTPKRTSSLSQGLSAKAETKFQNKIQKPTMIIKFESQQNTTQLINQENKIQSDPLKKGRSSSNSKSPHQYLQSLSSKNLQKPVSDLQISNRQFGSPGANNISITNSNSITYSNRKKSKKNVVNNIQGIQVATTPQTKSNNTSLENSYFATSPDTTLQNSPEFKTQPTDEVQLNQGSCNDFQYISTITENLSTFTSDSGKQENGILNIIQQQQQQRCINHYNKKAKYVTFIENENKFVCSRCAIELASKGAKIIELLNSDEAIRKIEIEQFLQQLYKQRARSENFSVAMSSRRATISQHFDVQEQKACAYFDLIFDVLQQEKGSAIKKLKSKRDQALKKISQYERQIARQYSDVQNILLDIEQNIDNIVKHIEIGPFKDILARYEEKLRQYDKNYQKCESDPLNLAKLADLQQDMLENVYNAFKKIFIVEDVEKLSYGIQSTPTNCDEPYIKQKKVFNTDSCVLISFQNKELFQSAVNILQEKTQKIPTLEINMEKIEEEYTDPNLNISNKQTKFNQFYRNQKHLFRHQRSFSAIMNSEYLLKCKKQNSLQNISRSLSLNSCINKQLNQKYMQNFRNDSYSEVNFQKTIPNLLPQTNENFMNTLKKLNRNSPNFINSDYSERTFSNIKRK